MHLVIRKWSSVELIDHSPLVFPVSYSPLFVDDLVLWLADRDIRIIQESLNTALDALLTWSNNNEMTVNSSKTVFQVFTLSTKPKAIQLFYGDYQLWKTQEATYLGIVLDSRLSWNKQASRVQAVGKTRNGLLKRLTGVK
ncbi:putative RNA-directed DNA polymerase from transposon BS [Trichonephila clavata]|uniref:Putative RNA-directed DNA polymerase from transposon BS n=1 Tax=Trichonephila clavata TaxID=2740835 RepID=A0A8X6I066_TRICU|nr:putative RNA-directed DNA polymerase from transposon BS [Trichonephila clavata]